MPLDERQEIIARIEDSRKRKCICFFNFDREAEPSNTPGLSSQFSWDAKEPLFRVLKEARKTGVNGVDFCFYTRGGHLNAVWPIVSLIREFDPKFEVLIPYSCNSAGTIVSLGASKIHLTPLSELSPIDPTGGNQFNPVDPISPGSRMGISVEDVVAYREFILTQFGFKKDDINSSCESTHQLLKPFLEKLTSQVHPLALGSIHRVQQQGRRLARELLTLNTTENNGIDEIIEKLSSKFYSHLHMINRSEAKDLLGDRVEFASDELAGLLDELLRRYEQDFCLRRPFVANEFLAADNEKDARFVSGVVESAEWSYLNETKVKIRRIPIVPPNIQIQLPPGMGLSPLPGLPITYLFELITRGWIRNTSRIGVTI